MDIQICYVFQLVTYAISLELKIKKNLPGYFKNAFAIEFIEK